MAKLLHRPEIFVFVLLLFIEGIQLCLCGSCIEGERLALLTLKQSFRDPSNRLATWTGEDCCHWRGVRCNASTGHVVILDLRTLSNSFDGLFADEVHSCLAELKQLECLDLSGNDFNRSRIPEFLGSFEHLRYLNLANANFEGAVPHQLGNLGSVQVLDLRGFGLYAKNLRWASSLFSLRQLDMSGVDLSNAHDTMYTLSELPSLQHLSLSDSGIHNVHFQRGSLNSTFLGRVLHLDLSQNELSGEIPKTFHNLTALRVFDLGYQLGSLHADNLQWLSSLSALHRLDMSGVNIGKALDLVQVLNTIPSLVHLSLGSSGIRNIHFTHYSANSTFLARIQSLDIPANDFVGPIPNALKNMTALTSLDISANKFTSTVPLSLVNSKSLVYLSMWLNEFDRIEGGFFSMLNHRCSLKSLDLSYNKFDGEVFKSNLTLSRCPINDLEFLDLHNNEIDGNIPNWLGQLKGLKELYLSTSSLRGTIPQSLGSLLSLETLDLSNNQLSGSVPESLGSLSALTTLDLSNNQLNGSIPQSLGTLSSLLSLHLSNNRLSGSIPQSLGRLSLLSDLGLSNNQLNGTIQQSLGSLLSLKFLHLSNNQLNGVIPRSLVKLASLTYLDLSQNQLSGIPESIGQLVNLQWLGISFNPLECAISELHFANLSKLTTLRISSTNLTWKVTPNWVPPFSLSFLDMSFCATTSHFPHWLQNQAELRELDLSNSNISGDFPRWFNGTLMNHLDLSSNQISGYSLADIVHSAPRIENLLLGSNSMKGSIPYSLCKLQSLTVLDLSRNKLSGEIPDCTSWRGSQRLVVINLSFNMLSGKLPSSLGYLSYLKRFHANRNYLDGEISSSLGNCTDLELLDLGENKFSGHVPPWAGETLLSLQILTLRGNMLDGKIPPQLCKLSHLQILDLAQNNLIGEVPPCFGNFTAMISPEPVVIQYDWTKPVDDDEKWEREKVGVITKGSYLVYTKLELKLLAAIDISSNKLSGTIPVELCSLVGLRGLNLSNNQLSGKIPNLVGNLKWLDTLDLSNNQLSGPIPLSMSDLHFISHLNLSNNNFSGKIPKSNQLQTLPDPSIYSGNPQLCGDPLPKKCPGDDDDASAQPWTSIETEDRDGEEEKKEKLWFWFIVMVGFAAGFWGVVGSLVLKRSWRNTYFRFADDASDRVFVMVSVKVARLKQRIQSRGSQE